MDLLKYYEKARKKSIREVPVWILKGLRERGVSGYQIARSYLDPYLIRKGSRNLLHEMGPTEEKAAGIVFERLGHSFFWSWEDRDEFVEVFRASFNEHRRGEILEDAEEVSAHTFDLLGSGKTNLGKKIDWKIDFAHGRRWPSLRYDRLPVCYEDGSDVIRIWELSRFQWAPTLGKAYWLTGDERYAEEFLALFRDWSRDNPVPYGPNWMSSQDIALRGFNWILTLGFVGGSSRLTPGDRVDIVSSLYRHGVHVENNLATKYDRNTGTHYLSQMLLLLSLGLLFRNSRQGEHWRTLATSEFLTEMEKQVNPDGGDYESSVSCYHKFALEHFVAATLLFLRNGMPVPEPYRDRLKKMFEFVLGYTRPDGTVPQFGDTDDGRVQILSEYSRWRKDDHRYLLAIGAGLFGREDFEAAGQGRGEEAFWLLHNLRREKLIPLAPDTGRSPSGDRSAGFPVTGFYFMKSADACLSISANPVGKNGKGNHKHNDIFSIDLYAHGTAFIVDPGTYVYTQDLSERLRFRSTAYHNTLQVNDYEQNTIAVDKPWRVVEEARPRVLRWETSESRDVFTGEHTGFSRFIGGLKVERTVYFQKTHTVWLIRDRLLGGDPPLPEGTKVTIPFHLNDLEFRILGNRAISLPEDDGLQGFFPDGKLRKIGSQGTVEVAGKGSCLRIHSVEGNALELSVESGWISPHYGIRKPAPIVRFKGPYAGQKEFLFVIEACRKD